MIFGVGGSVIELSSNFIFLFTGSILCLPLPFSPGTPFKKEEDPFGWGQYGEVNS